MYDRIFVVVDYRTLVEECDAGIYKNKRVQVVIKKKKKAVNIVLQNFFWKVKKGERKKIWSMLLNGLPHLDEEHPV